MSLDQKLLIPLVNMFIVHNKFILHIASAKSLWTPAEIMVNPGFK